jgi:hypothetical protein
MKKSTNFKNLTKIQHKMLIVLSPGCQEVIQKPVTVNCPACQASPNMIWNGN